MNIKVVYPNEVDPELTEEDIEMDRRAKEAVRADLEKAKFLRQPIARYDEKTKTSYIEYPDGSIKYAR